MKKIIVSLFLLLSCTPNSYEGFQKEGESLSYAMAKDLQKVQTLDDLSLCAPRLKKKLDKLTDLMIAAHRFSQNNLSEQPILQETHASKKLQAELSRIYTIEGGREAFEQISADSLQKIQLNLK